MINSILFFMIFVMTALGTFAGLFLKKASKNLEIKNLICSPNLYLGGILYLSAAIINIYVLKFLDFSLVLPMTSITYVWTMLISKFILKEKITTKKILGTICIIVGATLLAIFI